VTVERLPKAYSQYGASMGRTSDALEHFSACVGRVSLARVPLDAGGYDSGGAYWGIGEPLWRARGAEDDLDDLEAFFRAPSREAAKAMLPAGVRFFR
jgi:hypothetical protein